jgi:hypothetical protein
MAWLAGTLVEVQVKFIKTITSEPVAPTHVVLKFTNGTAGVEAIYVYTPSSGAQLVTNPLTPNPEYNLDLWDYSGGVFFITGGDGLYTAFLDTTALPGIWSYTYVGRGVGQSIASNTFVVVPAPI